MKIIVKHFSKIQQIYRNTQIFASTNVFNQFIKESIKMLVKVFNIKAKA